MLSLLNCHMISFCLVCGCKRPAFAESSVEPPVVGGPVICYPTWWCHLVVPIVHMGSAIKYTMFVQARARCASMCAYIMSQLAVVRQHALNSCIKYMHQEGVFLSLNLAATVTQADKVATGHNADDIAETVLLNILRGDLPRLSRCAAIITGLLTVIYHHFCCSWECCNHHGSAHCLFTIIVCWL